jgi:hypothetical protein
MTGMYDGFGNSESDEVSNFHTIFNVRVEFLRNVDQSPFFSREDSKPSFLSFALRDPLAMVLSGHFLVLKTLKTRKYRGKCHGGNRRVVSFSLTFGRKI